MPVEEISELGRVIQQLDSLQLVFFFFFLSEIGLIGILLLVLKNNSSDNKRESDANVNTFKMMSQIYNSFSTTTETFKREQEKDWQRTQQFFKAFNELSNIQKRIFYALGRLETRIEKIEKIINEDKNG